MLTVSVVNGCRACCYMHSRFALRAGVSTEEIQRVRMGDWAEAPQKN